MAKKKQTEPKKLSLQDRIKDVDDLASTILEINDKLDKGLITVEQARALTGNYKLIVKLIDGEFAAAKFTGRMDGSNKRWYPRVASSAKTVDVNPGVLMEQLQAMLEANASSKPTKKNGKKQLEN